MSAVNRAAFPIEATEKAPSAWRNATARLQRAANLYPLLADLEPVGERGGALVLIDPSGTARFLGRREAQLVRDLIAPLGYRDIEIVDLGGTRPGVGER